MLKRNGQLTLYWPFLDASFVAVWEAGRSEKSRWQQTYPALVLHLQHLWQSLAATAGAALRSLAL